jgi:hypothetical protein
MESGVVNEALTEVRSGRIHWLKSITRPLQIFVGVIAHAYDMLKAYRVNIASCMSYLKKLSSDID